MTTIAQVREGLTHVGQQLAAGTAMSAEVMGSVLAQLVVFFDIVSRFKVNHQNFANQVVTEVSKHQGMLDVLAARPSGADRAKQSGILESKAVSNLSSLG